MLVSPVFADDAKDLQRANELNSQVMKLNQVGNYNLAIDKNKEALAIRERVLGPEHSDVAQSLNNLAELYYALGHYAESEPL